MDLQALLGDEAESLLSYIAKGIPKDDLILPGPDFVDRVFVRHRPLAAGAAQPRRRSTTTAAWPARATCRSCPVDQGIEHSAAASFAPNPNYFDPENIVELAIEGGCNAVATTFGVLGAVEPAVRPQASRSSSSSTTTSCSPTRTSSTRSCSARCGRPGTWAPPASAPRSTSAPTSRPPDPGGRRPRSRRPTSSACSPCCGATCATTPSRTTASTTTLAADLTGQANHLGVTIEADIIKQKLPENNGGYNAVEVRQDEPAGLRRAHHRQPDRPAPAGRSPTATWAASG